jgi:hypothetical protein
LILEFLYDVFNIIKFFFGLGALVGLLGIGLVLLWFVLRVVVRYVLREQPIDCYVPLRKLFLDL